MTTKEICDTFYRDLPQVTHRVLRLDLKKYEHLIKTEKTGRWLYFSPINFVSKDKNEYVIIPDSPGWSDYKKNGLLYIILLFYKRPEGLYAVLNTSDASNPYSFAIFPPHFFQRYQERFLHRPDLDERQTIIEFIKRGNSTSTGQQEEKFLYSVTNEGYFLGEQLEKGIDLYKTYVSFDLLKGDQVEKKALKERLLNQFLLDSYGRIN